MPHKNLVLVRSFRQHEHEWSTGLFDVCCKEPCYCLSGFFCFPCTNYSIRKDALGGDLRNYRCFQMYYCDCLGYCCPCQESCGSCCLCAEAFCCPHLSVMATRHTIQQRYRVRNTCCENCCFDMVVCADCLLCCLGDESPCHHALHCIVHAFMCLVMPCMQAQHHHQIVTEENMVRRQLVDEQAAQLGGAHVGGYVAPTGYGGGSGVPYVGGEPPMAIPVHQDYGAPVHQAMVRDGSGGESAQLHNPIAYAQPYVNAQ